MKNERVFGVPGARGWVAGLVAVSLTLGALGMAAPQALADDGDLRIPIPDTAQLPSVDAASGTGLLVDSYDEASDTQTYRASNDSGKSWQNVDLSPDWEGGTYTGGGHLYFQDSFGGTPVVKDFDFATNQVTPVAELNDLADLLSPSYAVRKQLADPDNDDYTLTGLAATDLASATAEHPLAYTQHKLSGNTWTSVSMGSGTHAFVLSATRSKNRLGTGYLDALPLNGDPGASAKVSGIVVAQARGDQVVYITGTSSGASLCFRSADNWAKPSCKTFRKGDQRKIDPNLYLGDDWALIELYGAVNSTYYVVRGTSAPSTPTLVKAPADALALSMFGAGDSANPLAQVATAQGGFLAEYTAAGTFEKLIDNEPVQGWADELALTPGEVLVGDAGPTVDAPGSRVWSRSISGELPGEMNVFAPRASSGGLSASDARTIVRGRSGVQLFDQGAFVRKLPTTPYVDQLSGAYYLADTGRSNEVRRIDGTRVLKGYVQSIFGSLALKKVSRTSYQVIDVTGASKAVKVTVPQALGGSLDDAQLWGDWILAGTDSEGSVAFNYRTNQTITATGYPIALGDRFALLEQYGDDDDEIVLWDFTDLAAPTTSVLGTWSDLPWITTDGSHRIAYNADNDGEIVIHELPGVGTSAPRLLGLIAPTSLNNAPSSASWKPEIDATKALEAGTLTITDSNSNVVRTIPVDAAPNGSIRNLSWNGRGEDDVRVKPGTYTWTLAVDAADGTGSLVPVDGTASPITGKVKVVTKSLGTVSLSTPRIDDTTPVVGQKISVKKQTTKPATGTDLAYQWYRGKTPITDATTASYTVTPDDLGQLLMVKVTGTADGWKTTVKSSAYTVKVAKGTLSAGTVSIDKTDPAVGDTLTADPGTWSPEITASYQWYLIAAGKATAIPDATGSTYEVQASDAGSQVQVRVTGHAAGYADKAVSSAPTSAVTA